MQKIKVNFQFESPDALLEAINATKAAAEELARCAYNLSKAMEVAAEAKATGGNQ